MPTKSKGKSLFPAPEKPISFELPNGVICDIRKTMANDSVEAMEVCNNKQSGYMLSLIAKTAKFNGEALVYEELKESLPNDYYLIIVGKMSDANFI